LTIKSYILILMLIFSTITLTSKFQPVVQSQTSTLELTVVTDKEVYNFGGTVQISGSLIFDGQPVEDGLVAIQVNDPSGYLLAVRTLDTGTVPSTNWRVEILNVASVDEEGNPKETVTIGATIYIAIVLDNKLQSALDIWITATVLDAQMVPIGVPRVEGTLPPGTSTFIFSLPISQGVNLGEATIYANAFTAQPKHGGTPYCPEKTASFTIVSGGSTFSSQDRKEKQYTSLSTSGTYNFTFTLPNDFIRIGNYTVNATSQYEIIYFANATTIFQVVLKGDINGDKTVDIFDCVMVALAYGSEPDDPNWNPDADINGDNIIDIFDMVIVALDFGRTAI